MSTFRRRDGFVGEKQINLPVSVLDKYLRNQPFLNSLYITYIGFYPKASFHYRERRKGCSDNILFYCLGGKGYYDTHSGSFELTKHQFTILPAHHFHRYQADINDPWTIYWVHFAGNNLDNLNELLNIERYITPTSIQYDDRFIPAWEEMYNALKDGYTIPNISYANLCLYRFISLFVFHDVKIKSSPDRDMIADAIRFLKANIHKMLTVEDIAGHFCYSSSHFSALFKNKTGSSPLEYFIQLKIHYSCQLLDQSGLRIKEIASKVGYEDPYYFSRLFCKVMGVSPNKYREKKQMPP
jgi:AraC-like DNA-binding protein